MSLDIDLLPDGGVPWLDASGPEGHVVLSTRIRLARNVCAFAFPPRASDDDRLRVRDRILAALPEAGMTEGVVVEVDGLERLERQLLHERHLISRDLAGLGSGGAVRRGATVVVGAGTAGVMINEEDHLRLQVVKSGFAPSAAYTDIELADRSLGATIPFAFHPEFGYLTSCPTNAGTGLRASVLIHLPGLVLTKEIAKVLQGLTQVGLTFRGLYGEGSEVVGNLFQLSNQTTLGKSEEELLDHLGRIVRQVIEYERQAREVLVQNAPTVIADKVWRAYGLLRYARSLSFEETMNLLSGVRLGVGLELVGDVSVYTLNKLLVYTQPAHVARRAERALTDPDLPAIRADFVRQMFDTDARRGPPGGSASSQPE
jgi:protein arginine kinase